MKKIASIFLGIACLFGIGAPLIKENDAKIAKATNYETYVDTFDVNSFPEGFDDSSKKYEFTDTESGCNYFFVTQRGISDSITQNPKSTVFVFKKGNSGDPDGVVSTNEIGYIRSIEVEFLTGGGLGGFPKLDLFLSDEPYISPQDLSHGRENDFKKIIDEDNLKTVINDDFKYFGLKSSSSDSTDCYIKSLKIEWELHDFSKTADISTNIDDGVCLKVGQKFQIVSSANGDGEYTNNELVYKSSNNDVFTVDENGLMTAVGSGSAKIRVQFGTSYIEYEVSVEPYNEIILDISSNATRIENTSDLHEGDIVYIVYEPQGKVLSEVVNSAGKVGRYVNCEINPTLHTLTACEGGEYFYVYGDEENGFSFISTSGETISFEDDEEWTGLATNFPNDKWDVSIENGIATIKNKTNSEKFITFDTEYDCYDAMGLDGKVAIYKFENSGLNGIALNDNENNGKSYALLFSQKFLNVFANVCDLNGNTNIDTLKSTWDNIFDAENCVEFANLNPISFLMLKNAEALAEDGDAIQKAVYLYEYIVNKYEELQTKNFLDRTITKKSAINLTPNVFDNGDDAILTIFVFGSTSLAICATALLARKKKLINK